MRFVVDDLVIEERPTGNEFYGEYVWPAGLFMCDFLKRNSELVKGKRVLELGSGTGLVGLYAAKLGASHVTLTDFIDFNIENIKRNIKENGLSGPTEPRWFKWGTSLGEQWDVILGSDVTYPTMDHQALWKTINTHMKPGGRCILAHHQRDDFNFSSKFKELDRTEVEDLNSFSKLIKDNCKRPTVAIIEMVDQ
jgi:predicted nicotinamide N-methyase